MKGGSKYQPLLDYLYQSQEPEVILTFTKIEEMLGEPLPNSALNKRAWWSNRSKGALQASSWMSAGYLVEGIDFETKQVTFRKPPTTYKVEWEGDTVKWNGELVKALRRHMGMSQVEFAQKLGVRQQTISDWETSTYDPRRSMAKYLMMVAEQAGFNYGEKKEVEEEDEQ